MISVETALQHLFALAAPLETEEVPIGAAAGRVLTRPLQARRDQPPFPASAMDGYAVQGAEVAPGKRFRVIGEAAAGRRYAGAVGAGDAVRIFTGAPVPDGADRIIIQEDVGVEGDTIVLGATLDSANYVRPAGGDFAAGATIDAPRRLGPEDVTLLAAMNIDRVPVARRPVVALIATGDELVLPGETPGPDQIIASNSFGLQALLAPEGAEVRVLPVARDTTASLAAALAMAADADLIVTIGGASVGDHDLVGAVTAEAGLSRSFYKVAMRPGKPLMAGRLGQAALVGLPGNPVSSMVCGHIFLRPMVRALQGLPAAALPREIGTLGAPLGANGRREHYMRARLTPGPTLVAFDRQDSSLTSVLAAADALIVRPVDDLSRATGDNIEFLRLRPFG